MWAELVDADATFAVISSGNYMIIAFRHRETRTLHLSPVYSIDNSTKTPNQDDPADIPDRDVFSFGLILTSVFVAALQDSLERAHLVKNSAQPAVSQIATPGTSKKLRMAKEVRVFVNLSSTSWILISCTRYSTSNS